MAQNVYISENFHVWGFYPGQSSYKNKRKQNSSVSVEFPSFVFETIISDIPKVQSEST